MQQRRRLRRDAACQMLQQYTAIIFNQLLARCSSRCLRCTASGFCILLRLPPDQRPKDQTFRPAAAQGPTPHQVLTDPPMAAWHLKGQQNLFCCLIRASATCNRCAAKILGDLRDFCCTALHVPGFCPPAIRGWHPRRSHRDRPHISKRPNLGKLGRVSVLTHSVCTVLVYSSSVGSRGAGC